ncbi:MAG: hypothetical protein PVS3B1_17510 [Ktedonobacteraceae bacterium]
MQTTSILLLLGAAGAVAILHSVLPDHWFPLAVVARTQRWSVTRVVRVTFLASVGHVVTSLILGGVIALIGLQFQKEIDTQQGHIIGAVLFLTGITFLIWGLVGKGPHGHDHSEGHADEHGHEHRHEHGHSAGHADDHKEHGYSEGHADDHKEHAVREQTLVKRLAAIAVPFGVAASPDLTILPVALAASAVGTGAIVSVLGTFAVLTIGTFIGLTVIATLIGYQIKGKWLEKNANAITSIVLIAIGILAYIGF